MRRLTSALVATLAISGLALSMPAQAEARKHGRVVHVHGPHGGSYHAGRVVSRTPGSTQVHRGVITHDGRGVRQSRSTNWGDGTLTNDVRRVYSNGRTVERNATVTRNGDGSVSTNRNRTGARGNQQSSWSTIYRTDDGYTRHRGATTSNGRGYNATRNVSISDDYVTVQRNATSNRGGSVSSTRNYRRPN